MPRPTAAQLSYGSVTVVFSTLAMLLMSRTSSGIGVAVIGTAALALGLLVAVTVPLPKRSKAANAAAARATARATHLVEEAGLAGGTDPWIPAVHTAGHTTERAAERVGQHSLRR